MKNFKCKCGNCRRVCCGGWLIPISEKEYFRLLGLKCSAGLRKRLDSAFLPSPSPDPDEYGFINDGKNGKCPLVDAEGYCSLQRECGEGAIPAVCRLYPRCVRMWKCPEVVCSGSCEKTVELIVGDGMRLEYIEREYNGYIPPRPHDIEYKDEVREKCMLLMSNCAETVKERIADIGRACGSDTPNIVYADIEFVLMLMNELVRVLGESNPSLVHSGVECLSFISENAEKSGEAAFFKACENEYKKILPHYEEYYAGLLLNHIFYECFPFADSSATPQRAFTSFSVLYLMMHFSSVCHVVRANESGENVVNAFCDSTAELFRCAEHSSFYKNVCIVYNVVMNKYKETR